MAQETKLSSKIYVHKTKPYGATPLEFFFDKICAMEHVFNVLEDGRFHQQSHLALAKTSTKVVATFWSFSILMLGCRFFEK